MFTPEILSPAGDKECFFAAISAGADAIYVGLKELSARANATNFNIKELIPLSEFARSKGVKVYIALNTMLKDIEIAKVRSYLREIAANLSVDALIIQDMGFLRLIKEMGFTKEIHLSTLANFSLASSFNLLEKIGVKRVVLPRELTIDEIKYLASSSRGIGLEVFVHGALCYGVSGRCYWSGMLGGRSGLRGMCVQPCRRIYSLKGEKKKFFSCRDLGLDVLTKLLLQIPQVVSWKIEGRKKGPHYVYYVTKAYRLLRDNPKDSKAKKLAQELLSMSLGRPTTHYFFLSHRRYCPVDLDLESASGLFIGKLGKTKGNYYIRPKIDLYPGDRIRISYEDEKGHNIIKVNRFVQKGKKYFIKNIKGISGSSVFLIDRKEPELVKEINNLKRECIKYSEKIKILDKKSRLREHIVKAKNKFFPKESYKETHLVISLDSFILKNKKKVVKGIWIYDPHMEIGDIPRNWWIYIDPVIWPEDEDRWKNMIKNLISKGHKFFILNSFYHIGLIDTKKVDVWLGPFANVANLQAIYMARWMGFKGVVVSIELSKQEYIELATNSPLPLGVFIKGIWPYTTSRTKHPELHLDTLYLSPKKEGLWVKEIGANYYVFPDRLIDLTHKRRELKKAGYKLFLEFLNPIPKCIQLNSFD